MSHYSSSAVRVSRKREMESIDELVKTLLKEESKNRNEILDEIKNFLGIIKNYISYSMLHTVCMSHARGPEVFRRYDFILIKNCKNNSMGTWKKWRNRNHKKSYQKYFKKSPRRKIQKTQNKWKSFYVSFNFTSNQIALFSWLMSHESWWVMLW